MKKILLPSILICLQLCVCAQQVSNIKNSWFGNSSPDPNEFMPQGIDGMYVHSDGTVYTNVGWEEGGGTYTQIKNQQVSHAKYTFGWGALGGSDICANSKYVYFSGTMGNEGGGLVDPERWPVAGKGWLILWRRDLNDVDNGPTFDGAKGHSLFKNYLVVKELDNNTSGWITGVHANEEEVFVATGFENKVRVYDANTMAFKREFTITDPHQIAMDSYGKLWIAIGFNATKIERYDVNGVKQPQQVQLPSGSFVGDFCIDKNDRILLGDVGQREQVLIYSNINTSPSFTGTFGIEKGIYSGIPGKHEPLKFNQIRGVGTDNAGNIYVCSTQWGTGGQGTIMESYNPVTSTLNWSKYCVMFVDAAGIDAATDGNDIYGKVEHFTIDYSKPAGEEATLTGYTINKYKYPHDPRLYEELASVAVRNIQGRKILAMCSMNGGLQAIYRFNPAADGEVAIPCMLWGDGINPKYPGSKPGDWLWRDANGDGQMQAAEFISTEAQQYPDGGYGAYMDTKGDLWCAIGENIHHIVCKGLDANGIPIYDGTHSEIPMPQPFEEVRRAQYDVATDRMYLGGATTNLPDFHPWRAMGRAIHRYDNWSKGNRVSAGELAVPFDTLVDGETVSFSVAGDYIFTAFDRGYTTIIEDRDGTDRPVMGQVNIYKASDNSPVGYIRPVWDHIGWMDVAQCIDAYKRKNGEYVIVQEDDGRNKNLLYRWCPTGDCKEVLNSINETEQSTPFVLFPNPANSTLQIRGAIAEDANYEISSLAGQLLQSGTINERKISIQNIKQGIYLLKIKSKTSDQVIKWVKE